MTKINLEPIKKDKSFLEEFDMDLDRGFKLLGQGEYNINYIFYSKKYERELLLRIAVESQMDLEEQISYEYRALKLLEASGRTAKVFYCDDRKELIDYGFLVMDYLPGRELDYRRDLEEAGEILADIHRLRLDGPGHLISPDNPITAIYEECLTMFAKYQASDYVDERTSQLIAELLDRASRIEAYDIGERTIINTELNSGNFLINEGEKSYLIDWEKPLYGYPAQDLGHFLAPTTTFWRTDIILTKEEIENFLDSYCKRSDIYKDREELWKSTKTYLSMNCLRGVTWCSMAYAEYQDPDKLIANDFTYEKIKAYLEEDFLNMIRDDYLNDY